MGTSATNKYLGQRKLMNCGMMAEIIEYNNAKDITIRFDDGEIIYHAKACNWNSGRILNPHLKDKRYKEGGETRKKHTGELYLGITKTMRSGIKATVIEYRNANDVDVKFEDGYICKGVAISDFQSGMVKYRNKNAGFHKSAAKYVGQKKTMCCGETATIVKYNGNRDIDIQFASGGIAKHKSLYAYRIGYISNTNVIYPYKKRREDMNKREIELREDIESAVVIIDDDKELELNEAEDGKWYAYQYTEGVGAEPIYNSIFENKPIITNEELIDNNIDLLAIINEYSLYWSGNIPKIEEKEEEKEL